MAETAPIIINICTLIILAITLVFLTWEIKELKKSTRVQAYQNVLSNYLACISRDSVGEPLYQIYFKDDTSVNDKDLFLFSALMNTFEMLYVQKDQKILNEVWDPWKQYFIELFKKKKEYREIWEVLKGKNLYHKGLTKIINEELNCP